MAREPAVWPAGHHDSLQPGRLWSLWDIMNNYGALLVGLGASIAHAGNGALLRGLSESQRDILVRKEPSGWFRRLYFGQDHVLTNVLAGFATANERNLEGAEQALKGVLEDCKRLALPVSARLLERALASPPKTLAEYEQITLSLMAELQTKLFVYIEHERCGLYEKEDILSPECGTKFPSCLRELKEAANAFVFGLPTACVFHSMRAAELGARALAHDLGVSFPYPLELADMHCVLDQIESKILAKKNLPKSADKDGQLKFYSEAAAQFRYFKDAWRVRVAHARESFTDKQALSILDHVRDLLEVLSQRLTEPF
ncbi:MAG: HEPN domain-containing protein [Alphaproteobacteria bacterium]|nr:HEPN domain-containing protein [Alphaproteobacteria bacterium]